MTKIKVRRVKSRPTRLLAFLALIALLTICVVLPSCNVTRIVTTESSSYQRGDTAISIVTRTVETYDASSKRPF